MNTFCWADLSAHDKEQAKRFYRDVFGWATQDVPGAMGREYSLLLYREKPVGGLFAMPPEMRRLQMTPHWTGYVQVDSVEATAERAGALGATVVCVMDVGTTGKMSIVKDPTGAAFALWEGDDQRRADLRESLHASCWQELLSTDVEGARSFYPQLFGWQAGSTGFLQGDSAVAGLLPMPNMPGVRSQWNLYFSVDDCDAAVARALAAGGKLVGGPFDLPGFPPQGGSELPGGERPKLGRTAVLQDPEGATFCVVKREAP